MKYFEPFEKMGFYLPKLDTQNYHNTSCGELRGDALSKELLFQCGKFVAELENKPKLVVILVGEDPASQVYVKHKVRACSAVGIHSEVLTFPQDTSEDDLIMRVKLLNNDKNVTGLLIQLPLPSTLRTKNILNSVNPEKDVDGFSRWNQGKLMAGVVEPPLSCTPVGIMWLLQAYQLDVAGCHAVVIGRSEIVGKPMAQMLLKSDATVTVCHSKTRSLAQLTKNADILIAAAGQKHMIEPTMIKKGAIVIDVGIHRGDDNKLYGDVAVDARNVAGYVSPVPGGVGPMTIAALILTVFYLGKKNSLHGA